MGQFGNDVPLGHFTWASHVRHHMFDRATAFENRSLVQDTPITVDLCNKLIAFARQLFPGYIVEDFNSSFKEFQRKTCRLRKNNTGLEWTASCHANQVIESSMMLMTNKIHNPPPTAQSAAW